MENPVTCVWETTLKCNMNCGHCGSSCGNISSDDELSTSEAFSFIDMCKKMGLKWISLSGGEPFIRPDLVKLLEYLNISQIPVNVISNGWLIYKEILDEIKSNNISNLRIMISVDGPKFIHDSIRCSGSFDRIENSFGLLNEYDIMTGCVTTVTKKNLNFLEDIRKFLVKMKVECWQFQLGLPMGNLQKDSIISPNDLNYLINYFYEISGKDGIYVFPADCIGYYNEKINKIIKESYGIKYNVDWAGCHAGIRSFGLLSNGDVVGCTSIRDKRYIEGNIRNRSLKSIWEDPNSFAWRRKFSYNDLKGDCKKCLHLKQCFGGCFNTRFTMNGCFDSENLYCTRNILLKGK